MKILLLVRGLFEIDLQSRSNRTWGHSDSIVDCFIFFSRGWEEFWRRVEKRWMPIFFFFSLFAEE